MSKSQKSFLIVFFSAFILAGLGLAIYGFVRLGQYNSAEKVQATVISVEYNFEEREMDVVFSFGRGGKEVITKKHFLNVKTDGSGRPPYYEGQQTTVRVNKNNEVVTYGNDEIIVTAGGGAFILAGSGFLYFFVLRKNNLIDMANEYEQAMVNPGELTDEMQRVEAEADQLTKLPARSLDRMAGEAKVGKRRFSNRLASFTLAENVIFTVLFVGAIVGCCVYLRSAFGILFGLVAFCIAGVILKGFYNLYFLILVRLGKFTEKKLATVEVCAFESSGSFQSGEFSRTHTVFKKFRVIARIDGKRSLGYVKGNVPPPEGAVLKVLIRPNKPKRWIVDNT